MIRPSTAVLLACALAVMPATGSAQSNNAAPLQNFSVPDWGRDGATGPAKDGRPRDPAVAPDGSVFFVGQTGNYIARLDPKTGVFKKFEIDSGAHPHTCIVDAKGMVYYSGNTNGTIGRLDPKTGQVTRWTVGEGIRDPHTMVFDRKGNIWFTAQGSNGIGYFDVAAGTFKVIKPPVPAGSRRPTTNPYGIALDSKGRPWINLFATNMVATVDPQTFELKTYPLASDSTLNRRIAITSDDRVYYTDYRRGALGRLDPKTGKVDEWPLPGGRASLPYGMTVDDQDRIWIAETGTQPNKLVGFDPKSNRVFSYSDIPGTPNTVRYMIFDKKTKMIWFGNDAGTISKVDVSGIKTAM